VTDIDGDLVAGLYATGWIKRGPVGLIGHTKSDAAETIRHLVEDSEVADGTALRTAVEPAPDAVLEFLEAPRGPVHRVVGLGAARRARAVRWASSWVASGSKVVPREEMVAIARGEHSRPAAG